MKRTRLAERQLPRYSLGEERMNMITHIVGGVLGIGVLVSCLLRAAATGCGFSVTACAVYGASFLTMFTISSVYHGLPVSMGKKVMQVIDHCTIYCLIAGTYTAVVLCAIRPVYPVLAWSLLGFEWGMALLATVFTAIDLKRYSVFSMICYIGMGWAVIPFWRQVLTVLSAPGFALLLAGGIAYTIGSVLYGLGKRKKWMHSIFHIFVVLGALLQYLSVVLYAL